MCLCHDHRRSSASRCAGNTRCALPVCTRRSPSMTQRHSTSFHIILMPQNVVLGHVAIDIQVGQNSPLPHAARATRSSVGAGHGLLALLEVLVLLRAQVLDLPTQHRGTTQKPPSSGNCLHITQRSTRTTYKIGILLQKERRQHKSDALAKRLTSIAKATWDETFDDALL